MPNALEEASYSPESIDWLGIDHAMAGRMRDDILGTDPISASTHEAAPEREATWSRDDIYEYGIWLCKLLDIQNDEISAKHIRRASLLGIGPSFRMIENVLGVKQAISRLRDELGAEQDLKIKNMSGLDCIETATELLHAQHGRLTRSQMERYRRNGRLPGIKKINELFGSIRFFQELIGCPKPKGEEELLEWGVAFKIQNDGKPITQAALEQLSIRGVGSSHKSALNDFSSVPAFDTAATLAHQSYEDRDKNIISIAQARQRLTGHYLPHNDTPSDEELDEHPYAIVEHITSRRPDLNYHDVIQKSRELDLLHTLWGYRFSNADLRYAS